MSEVAFIPLLLPSMVKLNKQIAPFEKSALDTKAVKVINELIKHGFVAYLVGGCVRDLLFNKLPKDFDLVTNATPEQIKSIFKRSRIIGRRFRLVHILFGRYHYLEVSTFRSGKVLTSEKNTKLGQAIYGTIEQDVLRRDFTLNALYYDVKSHCVLDYVDGLKAIKNKKIVMIGKESLRYQEDPVRLLRAIRFKVKFNLKLTQEQQKNIKKYAHLLADIPPARLYEESLKLFHNEDAYKIFSQLINYQLLIYLFPNTQTNPLIKLGLKNTEYRIKKKQSINVAFFFAIFLWHELTKRYAQAIKQQNPSKALLIEVGQLLLAQQIKHTAMAKYLSRQILDIWLLQNWLEKSNQHTHPKNIERLLNHPKFRMAYDFLLLRSQSINPELKSVERFWFEKQKGDSNDDKKNS